MKFIWNELTLCTVLVCESEEARSRSFLESCAETAFYVTSNESGRPISKPSRFRLQCRQVHSNFHSNFHSNVGAGNGEARFHRSRGKHHCDPPLTSLLSHGQNELYITLSSRSVFKSTQSLGVVCLFWFLWRGRGHVIEEEKKNENKNRTKIG